MGKTAMTEHLPITDEEWEKLRGVHFSTRDFSEALKLFDSVRHLAGASDFSEIVHANFRKVGELAVKVFCKGQRDSVYELFFETASLDSLMRDMEDWLTDIRAAFASLDKIRPESLSESDET
jgi:hypothetical protein